MSSPSKEAVISVDVLLGVAIGLGLWLLKSVCSFLYVPSCATLQKKALQTIKPLGNNQQITVWGFQELGEYPSFRKGVCDGSPYVARFECYLRLLEQPYVKKKSVDLSENPRSKLPFANVYGNMVDGSEKIMRAIDNSLKLDPMASLTKDQQLQVVLIRHLLTGSFYWIRYQMNFGTEGGRQDVRDAMAKQGIPFPMLSFINAMIIKSQTANLIGQGIGRMPFMDVVDQGKNDLRTLAAILDKSKTPYILGTEIPTVLDTDVYAFVSHLFYDTTPSQMDWVVSIKEELPLLIQYIDHMRDLLFSELKKKSS